MAKIKSIREEVDRPLPYRRISMAKDCEFNTDRFSFDNIFSFLICKDLTFDLKKTFINYNDKIPPKYYHNLFLSLEDGISGYTTEESPKALIYYPFQGVKTNSHYFYSAQKSQELSEHIVSFLSFLHSSFSETTLLEIQMVKYLTVNAKEVKLYH